MTEPWTDSRDPYVEQEIKRTNRNQQLDVDPMSGHLRYEDGGYDTVILAPGQDFTVDPSECLQLDSAKNVEAKGFAVTAVPIALIYLSDKYPVLLFDRGEQSEGKPENLIKMKRDRENIIIDDRFFMVGEEALVQIEISADINLERQSLNAYKTFNPGDRIFLGRDYSDEFNSRMHTAVSQKHLVIEARRDGLLVFKDLYSTNHTKIQFVQKPN